MAETVVMPANTFAAELRITDARGRTNYYKVVPLAADADVARAAWRLTRLEEVEGPDGKRKRKPGGASYDVCLRREGFWACECLGYLRYNACKHTKVLSRLLGGVRPQDHAKKSTPAPGAATA